MYNKTELSSNGEVRARNRIHRGSIDVQFSRFAIHLCGGNKLLFGRVPAHFVADKTLLFMNRVQNYFCEIELEKKAMKSGYRFITVNIIA
jgi:hypothetical protein